MRIVITGASGNVGTALLRKLAGSGHEVRGVSRRRPPDVAPYRGVPWTETDLADLGSARLALDEALAGADAVVHLAWMIQPSHDRELLRRANQGGTRVVAEAALAAGVAHLLHMSSIGAYSPGPKVKVDESWPTAGIGSSHYSVDKVACEELLAEFAGSLVLSRARPTLILQEEAASEISRYFIGRLVPVSVLRRPLVRLAPWPEELALQFVHAADVAAALTLILEQRAAGDFNIAAEPIINRARYRETFGGVGPSMPKAALRALADLSWRAHLQPTDAGWIDLGLGLPLLDTARIRSLGWVPQHDGDETLRRFVDALAHRRGGSGPLLHPRRVLSG